MLFMQSAINYNFIIFYRIVILSCPLVVSHYLLFRVNIIIIVTHASTGSSPPPPQKSRTKAETKNPSVTEEEKSAQYVKGSI